MTKELTISSTSLGDFLRKLRLKKGYSQYYMAAELNISQNSYCLLENGQTKLNIERLVQIAQIFNLSPREFLLEYFEML